MRMARQDVEKEICFNLHHTLYENAKQIREDTPVIKAAVDVIGFINKLVNKKL